MSKQKKAPIKTRKSNDPNEIIDLQIVDEVVEDLVGGKKDPRWQKFLCYWIFGLNAKSAAIKAGYAKSYAESGVQKRLKDPKVKAEMEAILANAPERYRAICRLRLVDIAQVEGALLEKLKDKPEKLLRNPAVVRQIKEAAGALGSEHGTTINWQQIAFTGRRVMRALHEGKRVDFGPPDSAGPGMVTVTIQDDETEE
jgi:hypothetical protein